MTDKKRDPLPDGYQFGDCGPDGSPLDRPLTVVMPLSGRAYHCLLNLGAKTLRDVITTPDHRILAVKNCGKKTLREIKAFATAVRGGQFARYERAFFTDRDLGDETTT